MFIIREYRLDSGKVEYVAAPPMRSRLSNGTTPFDGTPKGSGAEITHNPAHAYEFKSHRAAARVRNTMGARAVIINLKTIPPLTFKQLNINDRFEFSATMRFSGIERGPWYKISARKYRKDTNPFADDIGARREHEKWNGLECQVGTINATVIKLKS